MLLSHCEEDSDRNIGGAVCSMNSKKQQKNALMAGSDFLARWEKND